MPRILIVEDDLTQKHLWNYIIERVNENSVVSWVTSETEAEFLIDEAFDKNQGFDLIISDIYLSDTKTGIDLWHKYFKQFKGKMILTSGIDYGKFVRQLGYDAPQPLFIQKPLVASECIESIYSVLKKTG